MSEKGGFDNHNHLDKHNESEKPSRRNNESEKPSRRNNEEQFDLIKSTIKLGNENESGTSGHRDTPIDKPTFRNPEWAKQQLTDARRSGLLASPREDQTQQLGEPRIDTGDRETEDKFQKSASKDPKSLTARVTEGAYRNFEAYMNSLRRFHFF